jgi:hypothetical protein
VLLVLFRSSTVLLGRNDCQSLVLACGMAVLLSLVVCLAVAYQCFAWNHPAEQAWLRLLPLHI